MRKGHYPPPPFPTMGTSYAIPAAAACSDANPLTQSRSILRLLRRPNFATSLSPMRRLFSASRPLFSFTDFDPTHWRRLPLMAAPNPPVRRGSRFVHGSRYMAGSGLRSEEEGLLIPVSMEHSQRIKNIENSDTAKAFIASRKDGRRTSLDVMFGDKGARKTTVEVMDGKCGEILDSRRRATEGCRREIMVSGDEEYASWETEIPCHPVDSINPLNVLPDCSHRDGSIFRGMNGWKDDFRIADRRETRLEAMMLSDPMDCKMVDGTCIRHSPRRLWQIFSLKLAKIPATAHSVELYGYIAARDYLDKLLNYVVNVSRDDPIIVEQGSLLTMTPKRGIKLYGNTLLEYDMRIKTGEQEKDDLQLIDGVSVIDTIDTAHCYAITNRILGDCGAIDITAARLDNAVEGTVEVFVSEVQGSLSLRLSCFSSGLEEEIRLFDGTIDEPRSLNRYVVAVVMGSQMDLKFKVGSGPSSSSEHFCSFKAHNHGRVQQLIKTDFASISLKLTWSALPSGFAHLRLSSSTLLARKLNMKL